MDRRTFAVGLGAVSLGLLTPFRASAKNKKRKKQNPYQGRWKTGSTITIAQCIDWDDPQKNLNSTAATWKALDNWNWLFKGVTLQPVTCSDDPDIRIISQWINGHHGAGYPTTGKSGYFESGTILVNTIDFYPEGIDSAIVAHELGHVLGAGHLTPDLGDRGCMERPVAPGNPDYPGPVTVAQLNALYGL